MTKEAYHICCNIDDNYAPYRVFISSLK